MSGLPARGLKHLTVRVRLLASVVGIAILLAGPALYSFGRLQAVRDIAFELHDRHAASRAAVGELRTSLAEADRLQRSYIITGDSAARTEMFQALLDARESYRTATNPGYGLSSLPLGLTLTELDEAAYEIDRLLQAGATSEASQYFGEARNLFGEADVAISRMASAIDRQSAEATIRAETIASGAATSTLIALAGALALALFIGLSTTQVLTRPLERLRIAMAQVAEGTFDGDAVVESGRRDELGDLARSFRSMTTQLSELNRLKAEFVSKTSHNLKTPINVIGGYAEMLEDGVYGKLPEGQADAVRGIREQVDALSTQVRQLVDLSRVEAHAFTVRVQPLYVADLLLGVQRSFEALARQRNIEFRIITDPSAPATILGDEDRLRNELLGNLLANAFKFSDTGDTVTVLAKGSEGRLEFHVSDTGLGIGKADLDRIFDRYYQASSGKRASGSGLGLAIAKEIVTRHGGTITASSEEGKGATFRVVIPVNGTGSREAIRPA
jgi:signal transduction histidine kinase